MANAQEILGGCEETLAKNADARYAMMKGYFKDKKMKEYEDRADNARAAFQSCRSAMKGAGGIVGAQGIAAPIEKELGAFEAAFVKWYENDEDVDDAGMFTHVVSLFRETKELVCVYKSCMGLLGEARKAPKPKEACTRELEKAREKYMEAAQKVDALAQQTQEERATDDSSTLVRYLGLNHEARIAEMMAPSQKNNAAERAISSMGSERSLLLNLRAHAYHMKNKAMQKAAMDALGAFFEYQGMLCACYAISDMEGG
ncbi:Uncharacterised protein [Candidatus Anstonella stagnisolia]|nr:Uncharacterised protein [Candidatus Anstonella stagnisolia]